jgi:hypothetical protein
MTLISTQTASSSASLDFTSGISSTYDVYMLQLTGIVPSTSYKHLQLYGYWNGSWRTNAGEYVSCHYYYCPSFNAGMQFDGQKTDTISISGNSSSYNGPSNTDSAGGFNGFVYLYNLGSTSKQKYVVGSGSLYASSAYIENSQYSGSMQQSAYAVTGIRVMFDAGNIQSGTARLYGISNS